MNELEFFWPDLKNIIVYGDVTFYQIMGLLTFTLSLIDAAVYAAIARMFKKTQHEIGKALRLNFQIDVALMLATAMMGAGALFELPSEWWQLAYVSRVGILILTPIVSIKLGITCYKVIKQLI